MRKLLLLLFIILLSCGEDEPTKNTETKFCTDLADMPDGTEGTFVRIVGLLPNPEGADDYNEMFELRSFSDSVANFSLYYILDDENVRWNLNELAFIIVDNGLSENCKSVRFISDKVAQLQNGGDVVYLYDSQDRLIQVFEYTDSKDGEWVYP